MGRYTLRARIQADTPDQIATALSAIAHEIEHDHDLTRTGEVVNTISAGGVRRPSWTVTVDHDTEAEVHA